MNQSFSIKQKKSIIAKLILSGQKKNSTILTLLDEIYSIEVV